MQESRRLASKIRDEMVRSTTSSARVPVGARRYEETDAFAQRVAAIVTAVEAPMISVDAAGAPGGPAASGETIDAITLLHTPVATTARRLGIPETHARLLRLRAIEALAAGEEG